MGANGGEGGTRTHDQWIMIPVLYRLSYLANCAEQGQTLPKILSLRQYGSGTAVVHSYGHQAQKWKNPIGQIQGHRTGTFFLS